MKSEPRLVCVCAALCAGSLWVSAPAADTPATVLLTQALAETIKRPLAVGTMAEMMEACAAIARKRSDAKFVVDWTELRAAGVTKATKVTIETERATFEQFIELILRAAGSDDKPLDWRLVDGAIHVTTQAAVYRQKAKAAAADPPARRPAAPRASRSRPRKRTGLALEFNEMHLETVISFFRDVTGLNFHANWKALEAIGVDKDSAVSLNVRGVTIKRALDLVVDQLSTSDDRLQRVYWLADQGVITITSGEALNVVTPAVTLHIGEALMDVPNFVGPRLEVAKMLGDKKDEDGDSGGLFKPVDEDLLGGEATRAPNRAERRTQLRDSIIQVIKMSIGEDMWEPEGKGRITILRDKLIITQTKLGWLLLRRATNK